LRAHSFKSTVLPTLAYIAMFHYCCNRTSRVCCMVHTIATVCYSWLAIRFSPGIDYTILLLKNRGRAEPSLTVFNIQTMPGCHARGYGIGGVQLQSELSRAPAKPSNSLVAIYRLPMLRWRDAITKAMPSSMYIAAPSSAGRPRVARHQVHRFGRTASLVKMALLSTSCALDVV